MSRPYDAIRKREDARRSSSHAPSEFEHGERVVTGGVRDMTPTELHLFYEKKECPHCHHDDWLLGPAGGFGRNIQCEHCNLKLNVILGLPMRFGQVLQEPAGYHIPVLCDVVAENTRYGDERIKNLEARSVIDRVKRTVVRLWNKLQGEAR